MTAQGGGGAASSPEELWRSLDAAWQEAFRQAWESLRTGNIPVGACATTPEGELLHAARNRVRDRSGPPGEVWGSALAHAEMNVLARLAFREHQQVVLTTTLEPCLQCAAAIRLGPVETVRYAGADRYWEGCHDFAKLSAREAGRAQALRIGPRPDELGTFATLISRFGPVLTPTFEGWLRSNGEAPLVDAARQLQRDGTVERLAALEVDEALASLWPLLEKLTARSESQQQQR